jgi:nucleoside-diphosphate kinase
MKKDKMNHPRIKGIRYQRTFCMVKPDGVMRGLTGEIIKRIEKVGLKIVGLKMITATKEQIIKHYPMSDQAWVDRLGDKGLSTFSDLSLDPVEFMGTADRSKIGKMVTGALVKYMTSGPVVIMMVEGIQAIDMVRKLAGHTLPFKADMGTIRGDFSVDSPAVANVEGRSIHNLFHASENEKEAESELKLWFNNDSKDIHTYDRSEEGVMYSAIMYKE